MKALDQETAASLARKMNAAIGEIIDRHGPRPPGSPGERACQEQLKQDLEAAGIAASVEEFPVAQKAFMAMPAVCSLLTLCALPLYWIAPRLSPVPVLLALYVVINELILYRHVLTPFFPKRQSANLVARIAPRGALRRRIIFVGHADAAFEWRFLRWFPRIFPAFIVLLLLSVAYVLLTTLAAAITGGVFTGVGFWQWLGLSHIVALPGLAVGLAFTNFGKVSPGAGDNLSGSLCAVELVKWMKAGEAAFEHTEVVALVTGSEEAGLVGARAFIEAHRAEIDATPTVVIAVDTMTELRYLALYNKDLNGRVAHDPRVCDLVRQAGETVDLRLENATVTVGASDAAAFTQAGIPAAALCAMNPAPAHYYHNRRDAADVVEIACLEKTMQLLAAICERYDAS